VKKRCLFRTHVADGHLNNLHTSQTKFLKVSVNFGSSLGLVVWIYFLFGLNLGNPYELMSEESGFFSILKHKLKDNLAASECQCLVDLWKIEE
jgi:hypothetical protein